ncbi:MAG: hypothetical protein ACTSX7_08925 [Alphaproteobacteria bacterium]
MSQSLRQLAIAATVTVALTSLWPLSALAENASGHAHDPAMHNDPSSSALPTLPGQDAFGAMAEIAEILSADPNTDWSTVDMGALREHLVDMNRVTLEAEVQEKTIEGGLEILVSGQGRTLVSIQNMVIAHAPQLDQLANWIASAEKLPTGARLTVTSTDAHEMARIRGLGFFGLMVSGAHHQPHHIGMARGLMVHTQ